MAGGDSWVVIVLKIAQWEYIERFYILFERIHDIATGALPQDNPRQNDLNPERHLEIQYGYFSLQ
jgi:hypothetical protein